MKKIAPNYPVRVVNSIVNTLEVLCFGMNPVVCEKSEHFKRMILGDGKSRTEEDQKATRKISAPPYQIRITIGGIRVRNSFSKIDKDTTFMRT